MSNNDAGKSSIDYKEEHEYIFFVDPYNYAIDDINKDNVADFLIKELFEKNNLQYSDISNGNTNNTGFVCIRTKESIETVKELLDDNDVDYLNFLKH